MGFNSGFKGLKKNSGTVPGKHSMYSLKKAATLGTLQINTGSTAVWNLNPEQWWSPLVQEKTYQEGKACGKKKNNNNNNNNERGTIRISFLLATPILYLTAVMLAGTWLSRLCLLIEYVVIFYKAQGTKGTDDRPDYFNLLKTKPRMLYLKTQSVPRCKLFSSRL